MSFSDDTEPASWSAAAVEIALTGVPGIGRVLYRAEVDSTIDEAWAREAESESGLVVVADRQRRGRGRAGRAWHSPAGTGLWLSWLFRPRLPAASWPLLPLVAGVAVAQVVETFGVRLLLKWPNDLVASDGTLRKAGGLLAESRSGDERPAAVLSLGLNVNGGAGDLPPEVQTSAVSLAELAGRSFDRIALLRAVAGALTARVSEVTERGPATALADWRERSAVLGRLVRLREGVASVEGIARDIDDDGALVVRLESGAEVVVRAGDVEVAWDTGS